MQGKKVIVSGSGNVATHAVEKCLDLGAMVLTMSDSTGYIYEPTGFTLEQLAQVMHIKNELRSSLASYKSATGTAGYSKLIITSSTSVNGHITRAFAHLENHSTSRNQIWTSAASHHC
jgi:glutamate dehydrogenase/leucine dehydrogenase